MGLVGPKAPAMEYSIRPVMRSCTPTNKALPKHLTLSALTGLDHQKSASPHAFCRSRSDRSPAIPSTCTEIGHLAGAVVPNYRFGPGRLPGPNQTSIPLGRCSGAPPCAGPSDRKATADFKAPSWPFEICYRDIGREVQLFAFSSLAIIKGLAVRRFRF